jgi:hypothetical protein
VPLKKLYSKPLLVDNWGGIFSNILRTSSLFTGVSRFTRLFGLFEDEKFESITEPKKKK